MISIPINPIRRRFFHGVVTFIEPGIELISNQGKRRSVSVFSNVENDTCTGTTNTAVVINRKNREWHSVNFMKENSLCQKEIWLGKLLDQSRSEISSKSSMVDVEAFLVVFKALSSLDSVQDASAPRRYVLIPSSQKTCAIINLYLHLPLLLLYHVIIVRFLSYFISSGSRADVWMNRLLEYNNKNLVRLVPEVYQHVIQCWANSYKEQPMVMIT